MGKRYFTRLTLLSLIAIFCAFHRTGKASTCPADDVRQQAIKKLLDGLKDEGPWAKDDPEIGRLTENGAAAVPALIEGLGNEDPAVRWRSARVLGRIGSPAKQAVKYLIETLKDKYPAVQEQAVIALGMMGPDAKDAIPALINALKDRDEIRFRVPVALAAIGSESISTLIVALNDENALVREGAVNALGYVGPAIIPALVIALKAENPLVRENAAKALGRLEAEGEEAVQFLAQALKDDSLDVRTAAALALGKIGPNAKDAVDDLVEALRDNSLGESAAFALGRVGAAALPALMVVLTDTDPRVRALAADAVGEIGPAAKDAVPHLITALRDGPSQQLRRSAARALGRIGPSAMDAVDELRAALKDEDSELRMEAAYSLAQLASAAKNAVPDLVLVLWDRNPKVAFRAAYALGQIGVAAKDAVPDLVRALTADDSDLQWSAANALGSIGAPAKNAILPLVDTLDSKNTSLARNAAEAIERIATEIRNTEDKEAIPILEEANRRLKEHAANSIDVSRAQTAVDHSLSALRPPGLSPWWLLLALPVGLVIIGGGIAISSNFYHWVIGAFGFHWGFFARNADASVYIKCSGAGALVERPSVPVGRPVSIPPDFPDFCDLIRDWRADAKEKNIDAFLVTAYVEQQLFKYDWNGCLSDNWTDPDGRVFSGVIYGVGPGDPLPDFPMRRGKMIVTALVCGVRPGDPPIPMGDLVANETLAAFKGAGFRQVKKIRNASPLDFEIALKASDICVIVAHAQHGSFRFPKSDFGATEWAQLSNAVRCRLLIIVGCGLGDLATPTNPLLLEVLKRGVTCVASKRVKQDVVIAMALLPEFCKEWRKGRTSGPTIGEAFRTAAVKILNSHATVFRKHEIDSYVILGTPTLRLEFHRTSR